MANRYWVGGAGTWDALSILNWSTTSGGAGGASVPTTSDGAYFDANSGSGTVSVASGATASTITMNSATLLVQLTADIQALVLTLTMGTFDLNGFTLQAQVVNNTGSNVKTLAFGSTGKIQITRTASTTFAYDVFNASDSLSITGTHVMEYIGNALAGVTMGFRPQASSHPTVNPPIMRITNGSFTMIPVGGFTFESFDFTGFSGTWNTHGAEIRRDITLSATMTVTMLSASPKLIGTSGVQTITSNGCVFNSLLTIQTAGAIVECADALTLDASRTLTFKSGTLKLKDDVTSTVGVFATSGATQKFLQSTLTGSQATLSQASGTVNSSYMTIQDINAIGGATWNAYTTNNNVDAGNNNGWDFSSQLGHYIYNRRKNKRILP